MKENLQETADFLATLIRWKQTEEEVLVKKLLKCKGLTDATQLAVSGLIGFNQEFIGHLAKIAANISDERKAIGDEGFEKEIEIQEDGATD